MEGITRDEFNQTVMEIKTGGFITFGNDRVKGRKALIRVESRY
jgi:hypothetical protein